MINLKFRPQALLITIPLLTLMASDFANAEIYKWRDNRGVTQYSDRPPVNNFAKITPNEMVNALQTKDLCTVGPIKKNIASAAASNKNFTGFFSLVNKGSKSVALTGDTSTKSFFGNNYVSVLGFSRKPVKTTTTTLDSTTSGTTTTSTTTVSAPTTTTTTSPTATTTNTISTEPLLVATTSPTTTTSTSSSLIQVGLMPAVDISKNMTPVVGFSDLRIRPVMGDWDIPLVGDGNGQFRIDCAVSHMSNDDPILYPNQQGAAHHHTFFGNTSVNFKSDTMTLSTTGNSTCRGGIANRSAYWVPSMIDTAINTPLIPYSALWYYKTGYVVAKEKITAPPKGLRIIAGNMRATTLDTSSHTAFTCFKENNVSPPASKYIPACPQGWTIVTHIYFPQCWDGKNLDSPDHKSHMAYSSNNYGGCPVTHPVAIPNISLNVKYLITSSEGTKYWRMSSDNYAVNGNNAGYSSHADWVNGWDETVIAGVVKNCLNAGKDCGNHMLGDGTVIYGDNVGVR